jgi:hypothetical protein
MKLFRVCKSRSRHYGYSIVAPPDVTWAQGPGHTFGWYKLKRDAQKRCDVLNRVRFELRDPPTKMVQGGTR